MLLAAALLVLPQEEERGTDLVLLALRYLARHQGADGAWGRRPSGCSCPAEPGPVVEAVDVSALVAALDDDDVELRAADPGSAFLRAGVVVASIIIHKVKASVDLGGMADADPSRMEMDAAYLTSMAVFQFDGPGGELWKRYREVEKKWIVPLQVVAPGRCGRGSWAATGTSGRLRMPVMPR